VLLNREKGLGVGGREVVAESVTNESGEELGLGKRRLGSWDGGEFAEGSPPKKVEAVLGVSALGHAA
jgi:hypothetical protein